MESCVLVTLVTHSAFYGSVKAGAIHIFYQLEYCCTITLRLLCNKHSFLWKNSSNLHDFPLKNDLFQFNFMRTFAKLLI